VKWVLVVEKEVSYCPRQGWLNANGFKG
jgi:hypothetical protein